MAEIGRWNGHAFVVSPDVIRGFTGLTIKGSSETEDKTKDKQKYVTRKNSKPAEVSITVNLNRMLNVDVRTEAITLVQEALAGETDYFYVGSKKLLDCKLMLTEAQVKETTITTGDTWLKADIQLTMKQADKYGSLGGGDGGGGGRRKKKKKSKKTGDKKNKKPDIYFADHTELTKLVNNNTASSAQRDISYITGMGKRTTEKMLQNTKKVAGKDNRNGG